MANARKCNRCERCFDPMTVDGMMGRFQNPFFQTSEDLRTGKVGKRMLDDASDAYVDLCPECAEMFEAFMCCCDVPTYIPGQDKEKEIKSLRKECEYLIGDNELKTTMITRLKTDLKDKNSECDKIWEKLKKSEAEVLMLRKERDEAHEDISGLTDENEWLNSLLGFGKDGNATPLIEKAKNAFMGTIQEMDPEFIKNRVVRALEGALFGEKGEENDEG